MKRICAALAIAGAMSSGTALADVQASATMGNMRMTLFDLDLTDAVTPSLEWITPGYFGGALAVSYRSSQGFGWSESYGKLIFLEDGTPQTVSHTPGAHAAIEVAHANPGPLQQALSLSLRSAPFGQADTEARGSASGEDLLFRLTPNTRVTFSIDLDAFAGARPLASHEEYLQLYAGLGVSDAGSYDILDSDDRMWSGWTFNGTLPDVDGTFTLSVDYSNPYDWERHGEVSASLESNAWARPVSAVPEPSTYAMLLAGTALFAWRRKKNAAQSSDCAAFFTRR